MVVRASFAETNVRATRVLRRVGAERTWMHQDAQDGCAIDGAPNDHPGRDGSDSPARVCHWLCQCGAANQTGGKLALEVVLGCVPMLFYLKDAGIFMRRLSQAR